LLIRISWEWDLIAMFLLLESIQICLINITYIILAIPFHISALPTQRLMKSGDLVTGMHWPSTRILFYLSLWMNIHYDLERLRSFFNLKHLAGWNNTESYRYGSLVPIDYFIHFFVNRSFVIDKFLQPWDLLDTERFNI
jgi:hypothetical protein